MPNEDLAVNLSKLREPLTEGARALDYITYINHKLEDKINFEDDELENIKKHFKILKKNNSYEEMLNYVNCFISFLQ